MYYKKNKHIARDSVKYKAITRKLISEKNLIILHMVKMYNVYMH